MTPADGTAIEEWQPEVSASYRAPSGIDKNSVKMTFNGVGVTKNSTVTGSKVSYKPEQAIENNTTHTVNIEVADKVGIKASKTWSFMRGKPKLGEVVIEVRVDDEVIEDRPAQVLVGTTVKFKELVYGNEGKEWKYDGLSYVWKVLSFSGSFLNN